MFCQNTFFFLFKCHVTEKKPGIIPGFETRNCTYFYLIKCIKGVRDQGCTERIVPYRVRKIARKATVTLWMEPV